MKKLITLLLTVIISVLCVCSFAEELLITTEESNKINMPDGLCFGMTLENVISYLKQNKLEFTSGGYYETTVINEPFSLVYLHFANGIDSFSSIPFSKDDVYQRLKALLLIKKYSSWGGVSPYEIKAEDANKQLIQVECTFTSDGYYGTATDTFNKIDNVLVNSFGASRFTSRRNEAISSCEGYMRAESADCEKALFCPMIGNSNEVNVQMYSQWVLHNTNNSYILVDHFIWTLSDKDGDVFQHQLIFTVLPYDISNGHSIEL